MNTQFDTLIFFLLIFQQFACICFSFNILKINNGLNNNNDCVCGYFSFMFWEWINIEIIVLLSTVLIFLFVSFSIQVETYTHTHKPFTPHLLKTNNVHTTFIECDWNGTLVFSVGFLSLFAKLKRNILFLCGSRDIQPHRSNAISQHFYIKISLDVWKIETKYVWI